MTKLVSTLFKFANIFVVALYVLACLIPFLPAGKFWMIAVLGLIFPILFFLVTGFMIVWMVARSKWFLLSMVAILLSWKQLSVVVGLNPGKEFNLAKNGNTLRVLSWNVSSWGQSTKSPRNISNPGKLMINLIKDQQADILCFQEFYDLDWNKTRNSRIQTFKEMGYPYSYFVNTERNGSKYHIGVAVLSKYPIIDTAKFIYGENDLAEHLIYADIKYHDQVVRVFTTHLQSVQFHDEQYASIRSIRNPEEARLTGSRTIISKLKYAYQYRGSQAEMLRQKIQESPYPAIVCGDFNDVPNSYTYFQVRGDLQDAFLAKGNSLGRTFRFLSPTLRIDYILADKKLVVEQFNRVISIFSDHYPVVADLNMKSL